jgi:hypothetical protein
MDASCRAGSTPILAAMQQECGNMNGRLSTCFCRAKPSHAEFAILILLQRT